MGTLRFRRLVTLALALALALLAAFALAERRQVRGIRASRRRPRLFCSEVVDRLLASQIVRRQASSLQVQVARKLTVTQVLLQNSKLDVFRHSVARLFFVDLHSALQLIDCAPDRPFSLATRGLGIVTEDGAQTLRTYVSTPRTRRTTRSAFPLQVRASTWKKCIESRLSTSVMPVLSTTTGSSTFVSTCCSNLVAVGSNAPR